jgi:hypothetical protein
MHGGHGYFVQVLPGVHTDASSLPNASVVIKDHVQGVLNVAGKPAGVYEYVFISTDKDGFCGMAEGEQAVVRVYLVPQLTGFPVLTNVCPRTTVSVNFNDFIPPEIKYFIDEMGWTISWFRDGSPVTMPLSAGLNNTARVFNVGNTAYKYTINDNSGEYRGKYFALRSSVYACPEDSAVLTHTVRIREGMEYAIPDKSISFCTDVLSLVPETWPVFNTNLFGYLGSSMPNGRWSLSYSGQPLTPEELRIDGTSGQVSINFSALNLLQVDSVVFKYSYQDCMAKDTFTLLSFNFKENSFTNAFVGKEQELCRDLVSGVVELSSIFGFTVPLTSGIWYDLTKNPDGDEMLYGAVDISDMKPGSSYIFRYDVNAAVDSLCLIQGTSTQFKLKMLDFAVSNAEVKICKSQFASGVVVDLSRYVPGLSNVGNVSNVTWRDNNGAVIPYPQNYLLRATEAWQTQDTSNYRMQYGYELKSSCGQYSGNLYISTVDSIGADTARKVMICYTDNYASNVDLFQLMGIAGASGNFELCDDPVNELGARINFPAGTLETISDSISRTGKLDMAALFNPANEREIYNFCYHAGLGDTCMKNKMEITVIVTRNVERGSDFK